MSQATLDSVDLDQAKVAAFAEKMLSHLNGAALSLMTSIGHRTGLFDLLATLPPATSQEIADAGKLSERYVREWLGAMVTGGIVAYRPETKCYWLPPEHAASLTRAAGSANFGVTAQFVAVLGAVENQVVAAFEHGRGVPYSSYDRFHEVMAEESALTVLAALFEHILPLEEPLLQRLEQGIDVADIGCGSGRALIAMAERFARSTFVGFDLCDETIAAATAEAERRGLTNIAFAKRDVSQLGESERFDLITAFDAIHDQGQPAQVLANIRAALKPGGIFLMQEIGGSSHMHHNIERPLSPFVYTISCMHCMSVSLAQGGVGLGAAWGRELAQSMLRDAGFSDIRMQTLEHDIMNEYYVVKK